MALLCDTPTELGAAAAGDRIQNMSADDGGRCFV